MDLLASIASRLGLPLRCEPVDWETALDQLLDGRLDMLCRGVAITPERGRVVSFSDPYLETQLALVLRRDSSIQAVGDLIGLNVGVRRATVAEEFVRSNCPGATVRTFDNHTDSFLALSGGTVSAVVDHETIGSHFVQTDKGLRLVAVEGTGLSYGLVFAPTSERLRLALNGALSALRSDGTWQQLRDRWLGRQD